MRSRQRFQHGRVERRDDNTLPPDNPAAFRLAMEQAFYGPLGELTVPAGQRFFAARELLPTYAERSGDRPELQVIFGIGRVFHIAFREPYFAAEYSSDETGRTAGGGL